jgi:hypothetical protein
MRDSSGIVGEERAAEEAGKLGHVVWGGPGSVSCQAAECAGQHRENSSVVSWRRVAVKSTSGGAALSGQLRGLGRCAHCVDESV